MTPWVHTFPSRVSINSPSYADILIRSIRFRSKETAVATRRNEIRSAFDVARQRFEGRSTAHCRTRKNEKKKRERKRKIEKREGERKKISGTKEKKKKRVEKRKAEREKSKGNSIDIGLQIELDGPES